MKIGLFGGTFDPIHVGHIGLAERFVAELHLDEVWLLVTPQNPWKRNSLLSDDDFRLQLVRKAVKGKEGLVASDYEFHLPKPSYTYQTLRRLREDYPGVEFLLLIGADNWVKFDHWAEHEEILANHHIAVYPREGYDIDESRLPENVHVLDAGRYDVSSTEIRQRLADGLSVERMVPGEILDMIAENYRNLSRQE